MMKQLKVLLLFLMLFAQQVKAQNCIPIATISHNNGYGCTGQKVSFVSGLSCIDATSWQWDFGDPSSGSSNSSILENPDHIFATSRIYTVTLKINGTYTASQYIYINTTPILDLGDDMIIHEGETLTIDTHINCYISQWTCTTNWSTGATSQTIEVLSPGAYYVTVCLDEFYDGLCCVNDTILITQVLGMPKEKNSITCFLSPNPFSESTTLESKQLLQNAMFSLYTIYGKEVMRIDGINGNSIILKRESLPSGIYVLRLDQGENLYTEKLIIKD